MGEEYLAVILHPKFPLDKGEAEIAPQYVGGWFILSTLAVFTYAICRGGAVRFQQIAAGLFGGRWSPPPSFSG